VVVPAVQPGQYVELQLPQYDKHEAQLVTDEDSGRQLPVVVPAVQPAQ